MATSKKPKTTAKKTAPATKKKPAKKAAVSRASTVNSNYSPLAQTLIAVWIVLIVVFVAIIISKLY